MRHFFKLILLLLLVITPDVFAQRKIYVTLFDNPVQEIPINSLSKITFSSGSMVFRYTDNTDTNFAISSVRRIAFVPYESTDVNNKAEGLKLVVYPNPARDVIYLKNLPAVTVSVSVYSLQGDLVKTQILSSDAESIDISILNPGMYLLKAENSIIKFTKL